MIILPQNVWCKYQTRFMYKIWHFETNLESIRVHDIFEANFVIFW